MSSKPIDSAMGCPDRRRFLADMTHGFTGLALASLMSESTGLGAATSRLPHRQPKAKRVLQIFCPGGMAHMDTWEYKPALEKYHGKPLPGAEAFLSFQGKNGNLMRSPWGFSRHGECGKHLVDILPHMGRHVDDIAFIHSMTSRSNTHGPGCTFMNTGFTADGFPANGACPVRS